MEKITTLNSYVAVEIENITRDKIDFNDGQLALQGGDLLNEKELAVSSGIVRSVPITNTDVHNHMVNADLPIKEGDEVFFDKMYSSRYGKLAGMADRDTFNLLFEEEGKKTILIPSRAIIMVKRGEDFIACNDYIIGKKVQIPKHNLELEAKEYKDRLEVVSSGTNISYKLRGEERLFRTILNKGDIAIALGDYITPISDKYEKHGLYKLRARQIIAKE